MVRTLTIAIAVLAAGAALAGPVRAQDVQAQGAQTQGAQAQGAQAQGAQAQGVRAQSVQAPASGSATATSDNAILLTVFLRHDQSRPLSELNQQLARQGFYKAFPPAGMEVVSWTVAMGIGQVIVLRLPAARLREVNRVLEDTAWGAYRTEFYPTYDYRAIGLGEHEKAQ